MKKNKNLITSFFSLCLTCFLLIFTIYAWYTANTEVSSSGITASTQKVKNVYVSEDYEDEDGDITSLSDLALYGFSNRINITYDGFLFPSSSYDGINYYIPNTIASSGIADTNDGFINVSSSSGYYISKTLTFCSFEENNIDLYLSNISISSSDSSSLYKSVRVSLTNESTIVYKCNDGGNAYPINSTTTVANVDPAISSGTQNKNFMISLDAFNSKASLVKVTLNIWIEGQNSYAVSTNDLSAFNIKMSFEA